MSHVHFAFASLCGPNAEVGKVTSISALANWNLSKPLLVGRCIPSDRSTEAANNSHQMRCAAGLLTSVHTRVSQ